VSELWGSLSAGDLGAVEAALAPEARWRAVEDGPWNCESRAAILDVLARNLEGGLAGSIAEAFDVGGRTVVAFRPETPNPEGWPLDEGVRYLVLSRREDGLITEMKGCLDRARAIAYAQGD
jgi:hypothetical protein